MTCANSRRHTPATASARRRPTWAASSIRNGIISYRLNALYGSGDGFVDESHERRTLADLGMDVHPWEHTTLELNYSNNVLDVTGFPGWFTYADAP